MINIDGKEIATDPEGYLANLDDWSEQVAQRLSIMDNLELTDRHWAVIKWIRGYFDDNGTAPNLRIMQKHIGGDLGEDFGDKKYLFELFPYGPAKQAARYAGMPKPTGCV